MKRVLLLAMVIFTFATIVKSQNILSGNVQDQYKKPFIGVKVTIQGVKGVEAITDNLGNFDIEVPPTGKVLVFTYDQMDTVKQGIGKKTYFRFRWGRC